MKNIYCFILSFSFFHFSFAQMSFGFLFSSNGKDSVVVERVFVNGPAFKAGLRNGDLLNTINNNSVVNKSGEDILSYLKFLPETNNTFVIKRNAETLTLKIDKAQNSNIFDCIGGECNTGICELRFMNGSTVKGVCKNGAINGEAIMLYANGNFAYKGNMVENLPNGNGKIVYPDSSKYEGNFVKGKREGKGKLTQPNGSQYTGEWLDNKKQGKGEWKDGDGNTYVGDFKNDLKEGKGRFNYFWTDNKYEGNWKNDLPDGQGTFTYKDGKTYVGGFAKGDYDGYGKMVEKNGNVITGTWKNNKLNGQATITEKDGHTLTGNFINDVINGKGEEVYPNGDKYTGDFMNDQKAGRGTYQFGDGKKYTGGFENNLMNGNGTFTWPDGRVFEGSFKDNNTIRGTLAYKDGKKITGDFNAFSPVSGKATIHYKDGRTEVYTAVPSKNTTAQNFDEEKFCSQIKELMNYSKTGFITIRGKKTGDYTYESTYHLEGSYGNGTIVDDMLSAVTSHSQYPSYSVYYYFTPDNVTASETILTGDNLKRILEKCFLAKLTESYKGYYTYQTTGDKYGDFRIDLTVDEAAKYITIHINFNGKDKK